MRRAGGHYALTNELWNMDSGAGRAYSELNTRDLPVSKEDGPGVEGPIQRMRSTCAVSEISFKRSIVHVGLSIIMVQISIMFGIYGGREGRKRKD